MPQNTQNQNKWHGYYLEDTACRWCLHYKGKSRFRKDGCELAECCCAEEKRDAIAAGRIKRKKGWNK